MKKIFLFTVVYLITANHSFSHDFPKIKDLKPESEAISYDQENLYEYINGAADAYLAYGFQNCITRDFSYKALKFSIDIYEMGSRINAFGMYQTERPTGAKGLKIGIEAVVSPPYQCLLLKGSNYIKINIFEGEFTVESGKQILEAVAAALKGSNNLPDELKLLPPKYKIANSNGYNRDAYLGLSILQRCVYAKYKIEHKTVQFYVMVPTNKEPIQAAWKKLNDKWEKETFNGQTILYKKIPYKGFTGVVQKDGKILGVADCENKEQMLKLLKTQIL
jgi:hypothetical protein